MNVHDNISFCVHLVVEIPSTCLLKIVPCLFLTCRAVKKSNCFHKYGHEADCHPSNYPFMTIFGVVQILLSQIPNFQELSGLSILAAIMSFGYSSIGVALSVAKIAGLA